MYQSLQCVLLYRQRWKLFCPYTLGQDPYCRSIKAYWFHGNNDKVIQLSQFGFDEAQKRLGFVQEKTVALVNIRFFFNDNQHVVKDVQQSWIKECDSDQSHRKQKALSCVESLYLLIHPLLITPNADFATPSTSPGSLICVRHKYQRQQRSPNIKLNYGS